MMRFKLKSFFLFALAITAVGCSNDFEEITEEASTELNTTARNFRVVKTNFYTPPTTFGLTKNLVDDYNVNNSDQGDDSSKLQDAIDDANDDPNGGKIIIPNGKYYFSNIKMKSNVHIEIAKGTKIFPTRGLINNKNHRIFDFGSRREAKVNNASIIGVGGRFTVDLRGSSTSNLIVADLAEVDNFRLANFNIRDQKTVFASILISFSGKQGDAWPHNGIVENISQVGAHTGYGLIQGYAGDNLLFQNLKCTGGVTLRLETDNLAMKEAGRGGLRKIFAKKIACTNGLTPLMFSPHFMENGLITVHDVTATGCAFAVRVEHGFIEIFDKENRSSGQAFKNYIEGILGDGSVSVVYRRNNGRTWAVRIANDFNEAAYNHSNPDVGGIKPGKFTNTTITGVKVTYKSSGAKLKQDFLGYLPCNQWDNICQPGPTGFEYNGPSIGVTFDNTKNDNSLGNYNINVTTSRETGFPSNHILSVKYDTAKICSNRFNTINRCN